MDIKIFINENMSLGKRFFKYLVLFVVVMWVFLLYIMVDGIFVSKGVGELVLVVVNILMFFINFIFVVFLLFLIGVFIIIVIYLGKKDIKFVNEVFLFNLVLIIILLIIILVIIFFNLDRLVLFLGVIEFIIGMVKDYLGIIIFFNGFFIVFYFLEVIIKIDGFLILVIVGVIIFVFINIIFDYLFVIEFGWGVKGVGIVIGLF